MKSQILKLTAILFVVISLASCQKKAEWPTITCVESYAYKDKPQMDETVTKEYDNRRGNTNYVSVYNPSTGRMIWIKRVGNYTGTNPSILFGEVGYNISCQAKIK